MKKGSNQIHGSVFSQFENDAMDARATSTLRYDPNGNQNLREWSVSY